MWAPPGVEFLFRCETVRGCPKPSSSCLLLSGCCRCWRVSFSLLWGQAVASLLLRVPQAFSDSGKTSPVGTACLMCSSLWTSSEIGLQHLPDHSYSAKSISTFIFFFFLWSLSHTDLCALEAHPPISRCTKTLGSISISSPHHPTECCHVCQVAVQNDTSSFCSFLVLWALRTSGLWSGGQHCPRVPTGVGGADAQWPSVPDTGSFTVISWELELGMEAKMAKKARKLCT